jgi:hypothetical protein
LELGAFFVAPPVGTSHAHQLEAIGRDFAGGGDVGAATEVLEVVLAIGRNNYFFFAGIAIVILTGI